ncbi:unnamed protein product [Caenorhabditis sp. 36 PRJEB53466]|nr:unnamed protein product [Caenorhabditis sp. 36 PRJEB53466]
MEKFDREELVRISTYSDRRNKWPLAMQAQMTTGPGISTPGFFPQPRAQSDSNVDDVPLNSVYVASALRNRQDAKSG